MSVLEEIRQLQPDTKELRKFSWTVGGAFLVLFALIGWALPYFFGKGGIVPALAWIGGGLIVVGTLLPAVVRPLFYAWMGLAFVLGAIMTRVILTIFFFIVLLPVGLFFKLIGRDALERKIDRNATTYWKEKNYAIDDRSRLEKFF